MSYKQVFSALLVVCCLAISGRAQQAPSVATTSNSVVPALSKFSGSLTDINNKPLTGITGVTFSLYKDAEGGAPLWMETQNVRPDQSGRYTITLGSATSAGLPTELFASGEARWLGVQVQGQTEKPRVLLMSVPYALKALDAQTLGGKPASAFLQASKQQGAPLAGITGSGKPGFIPVWQTATKLGDSNLFQFSGGSIGIGTTLPAGTLDVNGSAIIRNTMTLSPSGSNPALQISNSQFNVSSAGLVNFVPGQTFPGTSTITGVTAGTDLTGGGASGNVTLNLDTTKVPQLNAANTFNATQSIINGDFVLPQTTSGSVGVLAIGGTAMLHNFGGLTAGNTFVGGAGNFNTTGTSLTGVGYLALMANSVSSGNTAVGNSALSTDTTGGFNTAVGFNAGQTLDKSNVTQPVDTFVGAGSAATTGSLANATAIGANAVVGESNALVLGCIAGQNNCGGSVNVGIGTTTPAFALDVHGTGNFTGLVSFASGQTFPSTIAGVTAGTDLTGGGTSGNVTLNLDTTKIPQLAAANTFTANQTVNGSVLANSFTGSGSGLTNVNAALLGSLTPSAFAQLAAPANTFAGAVATITTLVTDSSGGNSGNLSPGLLLGGTSSGEGISSNRQNGNKDGIDFYTDFTSRMSITNGGRVGIATSAPQFNLDVNSGDAVVRGADNFQKAGDTANIYIGDTSHDIQAINAGGIAIGTFQKSNALFIQDSSGNVGIGTTKPAQQLEVNGSAEIDNALGIGSVPVAIFSVVQNGGKAIADGWIAYSSRRWKTNIHTLHGALDTVEKLRGVSYDMKGSGKHEVGVIAEEVGAVVPEVVTWEKNGKDAQGVDYSRLTALLIEATKQQQALIHKQQAQIRVQQVQIKAQQTAAKVQQAQIANLASQVKTIQTALHESGRTDAGVLTAKAITSVMHP